MPIKDNHQKSLRKPTPPETTEIHTTLKHLKGVSGAIVLEATHIRNGGPYLVQLCKGEPVSEESWYNPGGHYKNCSKIVLKNLEPANRYYARVRTDGPNGPGPWSHPVSIIVL